MVASSNEHKKNAPKLLRFASIAVSSSRYDGITRGESVNDPSGETLACLLKKAGYVLEQKALVSDDKKQIVKAVNEAINNPKVDVVITYGGTGVSQSDITIEALRPVFEKELPGFGELFRKISFDQIGAASILTRATAGVIKGKVVFCLPGSQQAVKTAMEILIIPEATHIVKHIRDK